MNISVAFLSKYELAKVFARRLYLCTLLASLLEVVTMKEALASSKKLSKMPSIVMLVKYCWRHTKTTCLLCMFKVEAS